MLVDKVLTVLPLVNRFCFCFSLRTGALIIGYYSMVSSGVFLGVLGWLTFLVVTYVNSPHEDHTTEQTKEIAISVYVCLAYFILVFLYSLLINLLLVIGVHWNKDKLQRIYVNSGIFLLVLALILVVLSTIYTGIELTIALLTWTIMFFYFLLIVRSLVLEMEERNKPRVYEMTTIVSRPLIA